MTIEGTSQEDTMLNQLTRGIGSVLGREIRKQYFSLKDRALKDEHTRKLKAKELVFLMDVLALSVFYRLIILPFEGSHRFWARVKKFDVGSISMGSYKLEKENFLIAGKCSRTFFAILRKYGLDVTELLNSDIEGFVKTTENLLRKRQNGENTLR